MSDSSVKLDLKDLRDQLDQQGGRGYWRALQHIANTPDFAEKLRREFPDAADEWDEHFSRRGFLKVMGASLALAGLSGCVREAQEKILPYVQQPEILVPGKPLFYASAMPWGGFGKGVIVEQHEGRPTKIEGNPDHPASLGASDVWMQASILMMYDPNRSTTVQRGQIVASWPTFRREIASSWDALAASRGDGFAILTETVTSPTLISQVQALKKTLPNLKWHHYDPVGRDNANAGVAAAMGKPLGCYYDFSKASIIVSLDSNFLIEDAGSVRYARQFADGRRIRADWVDPNTAKTPNRLYITETTPSVTGSVADHRLPALAGDIPGIAAALAKGLGMNLGGGDETTLSDAAAKWVAAASADLLAAKGNAVVVVGESQPPAVHALAHAMNAALASKAVAYIDPVEADPSSGLESLKDLVADMTAGAVKFLLILGGNPVYNAPADLDFATAMLNVPMRVRLGMYQDETSFRCNWHLPESHYLEAWGDIRAYDGTASIIQPLIYPLYDSKSAIELLAMLNGDVEPSGYDIVRTHWTQQQGKESEDWWRLAVEKGVIPGTTSQPVNVTLAAGAATSISGSGSTAPSTAPSGGMEITFRPDPHIWDGAWTNNGWLQELPKPISKIVWDNAAIMSIGTAEKLQVWNDDLVTVTANGRSLTLPVWVQAGQADNSITIHLGYGRTVGGDVARGSGFNAYLLRTTDALWSTSDVSLAKADGTYLICAVHTHHSIESRKIPYTDVEAHVIKEAPDPNADASQGLTSEKASAEIDNRNLIRVATFDQYKGDTDWVAKLDPDHEERLENKKKTGKVTLSLYGDFDDLYAQNYQWGMSIDTQTCIGCNACVIACQAENNIPVVGKGQVQVQREMHWIRIDTYYQGDLDNPAMYHLPVPCMHCENAPCEYVCPVEATAHDYEGTNNMIYNRCVGTRYCSNNCPYKVRRFNFFAYTDYAESLKLQRNPNVTVRSRGVMEKCTYCIQRISETRYSIEKLQVRQEERARGIRDNGDDAGADAVLKKMRADQQAILDGLQSACQQACPTEAIVFGNINMKMEPTAPDDPGHLSAVQQLKDNSKLDYGLLTELTTRPRTTYLARILNPSANFAASEKGST